jgi:phosphomannomutase/phosphoglucomutase
MALFREYDLRGVVGEELTEAIAEQVGRAYATMAREQGASRISLGRDGRLSSPGLQQALLRGLLAGGLDVVDLGLCASPLLYFSLFTLPVDGGIMITGSHNAAEYNGFKICIGKEAIHGERFSGCGGSWRPVNLPPVPDDSPLIPSSRTTWSISKRIFPACGRTISMS